MSKSTPILFSGPMVRALLDGTKTQTRRVIKPRIPTDVEEISEMPALDPVLKCVVSGHSGRWQDDHGLDSQWDCPYGVPGDRLWVRETWASRGTNPVHRPSGKFGAAVIEYRADGQRATWDHDPIQREVGDWRPSIFMPRWACRLLLEITEVRVERLQDISPADCRAEGMPAGNTDSGVRYGYGQLWNQLNEKRGFGWSKNPWIWAITFKKVDHA